jgi:putative transposase
MATPKHRTVPGTSFFVTTKCWEGRTIFQVAGNAEILVEALFHYRDSGAYLLHEFVIMPDHLHLLATPGGETSLEKVMQLIKGGSSHQIHKARDRKMEIWQVGFYDWTIRGAADWKAKVHYIWMNPVRARLVENARDWKYSSASGRFRMNAIPARYLGMASGAKAPVGGDAVSRGLKPPPPEEQKVEVDPVPQGLKPPSLGGGDDVGAKALTPGDDSVRSANDRVEESTLARRVAARSRKQGA